MTKTAKDPVVYWLTMTIFAALCGAVISLTAILYLVWFEPQEMWNDAERITGTVFSILALAFALVLIPATWKKRNG